MIRRSNIKNNIGWDAFKCYTRKTYDGKKYVTCVYKAGDQRLKGLQLRQKIKY